MASSEVTITYKVEPSDELRELIERAIAASANADMARLREIIREEIEAHDEREGR
jgi:hypothetical protein